MQFFRLQKLIYESSTVVKFSPQKKLINQSNGEVKKTL